MVSDIAGTTRDVIEDEISIEGIAFRFIDTAGLRETDDRLEAMGIERTHQKMKEASLIIYLFDVNGTEYSVLGTELAELEALGVPVICVGNKIDSGTDLSVFENLENFIAISAAQKIGIETLKDKLLQTVNLDSFKTGNTIVTNIRHYDALLQTRNALQAVLDGMDMHVTGDFLAMDIRQSLHYLGEIVGEITHEDLLDNIFSKFCIGK
jgi:tRNA modification GTPase